MTRLYEWFCRKGKPREIDIENEGAIQGQLQFWPKTTTDLRVQHIP